MFAKVHMGVTRVLELMCYKNKRSDSQLWESEAGEGGNTGSHHLNGVASGAMRCPAAQPSQ